MGEWAEGTDGHAGGRRMDGWVGGWMRGWVNGWYVVPRNRC